MGKVLGIILTVILFGVAAYLIYSCVRDGIKLHKQRKAKKNNSNNDKK